MNPSSLHFTSCLLLKNYHLIQHVVPIESYTVGHTAGTKKPGIGARWKKKKKASDYPLNGFHSHPPLLLLYGHCFRCWQALKQAGEMTHMCCFIVRHASPVVKYVTVVPTRPCERSGLDPDEGLDQLQEEQNTHSKS